MHGDGGATNDAARDQDARMTSGHVQALDDLLSAATSLDEFTRGVLAQLAQLPDVALVGLGLTEGAGRRLRFVSSEHAAAPELPWSHIDAYDDVPLTAVVRTGKDLIGCLDQFEMRFPGLVERQRKEGVRALAAVPLPGVGSSVGGLILFYDTDQLFGDDHRHLLGEAAQVVADVFRRVSTVAAASLVDSGPEESDGGTGRHSRIELDGDPRAASAVRRFLREQLDSWAVDADTVDNAELCASELVNNVIMHAGSAFRLNVHLEDGALTVTVRDVGRGAPDEGDSHVMVADQDSLRVFGRGLTLIDALAARWGSDRDPSGTIAWFVLEPENGPVAPTGVG